MASNAAAPAIGVWQAVCRGPILTATRSPTTPSVNASSCLLVSATARNATTATITTPANARSALRKIALRGQAEREQLQREQDAEHDPDAGELRTARQPRDERGHGDSPQRQQREQVTALHERK